MITVRMNGQEVEDLPSGVASNGVVSDGNQFSEEQKAAMVDALRKSPGYMRFKGESSIADVSASDVQQFDDDAEMDILQLFGDDPVDVVFPVDIAVKGRLQTFYIKQHSPKEAAALNARAARMNKNAFSMREKDVEDSSAVALAIVNSVVVNVGTEDVPQWVPKWKYEEIAGREERHDRNGKVTQQRVVGLMDRASLEAKDFINQLSVQVLNLNPELNPFVKKTAERMMEEQILNAQPNSGND